MAELWDGMENLNGGNGVNIARTFWLLFLLSCLTFVCWLVCLLRLLTFVFSLDCQIQCCGNVNPDYDHNAKNDLLVKAHIEAVLGICLGLKNKSVHDAVHVCSCCAMKSHPTRLWKLFRVVSSIYRTCTKLQRILLFLSSWNRAPIGIRGFLVVICGVWEEWPDFLPHLQSGLINVLLFGLAKVHRPLWDIPQQFGTWRCPLLSFISRP